MNVFLVFSDKASSENHSLECPVFELPRQYLGNISHLTVLNGRFWRTIHKNEWFFSDKAGSENHSLECLV
jgi:hypothetical protein